MPPRNSFFISHFIRNANPFSFGTVIKKCPSITRGELFQVSINQVRRTRREVSERSAKIKALSPKSLILYGLSVSTSS